VKGTQGYRADCRFFTGEKPCAPHKTEGVTCGSCPRYQAIKGIRLIFKLAAAGDVLRSTAIIPALRRRFPQSALWWITAPGSKPLLQGHPGLDWISDYLSPISGILEKTTFEAVYNLDMSRESCSMLAQIKKPGKVYGFKLSKLGTVVPANSLSRGWFNMGLWDSIKRGNRLTYQEHLLGMSGLEPGEDKPELYLSQAELDFGREFHRNKRLGRYSKLVGFNIGAGGRWPTKKWPSENFIQLARLIKTRQPKTGILLYGGPEESAALAKMAARLKGTAVNTGSDNSLRRFAALVGLSDILVTGDTLALHVGVALGLRVAALFGPTSDSEIDLYGNGVKLTPSTACVCYYLDHCRRDTPCLSQLTAETVYHSIFAGSPR